jgi:hypothetical protein
LASPEIAVQRIQTFLALHGSKADLIERFRLVPAPPLSTSLDQQATVV